MWAKVRQLTGRSKTSSNIGNNAAMTADALNEHYAAISTYASYTTPSINSTANNWRAESHITDWRMFEMLDTLRSTATGLDNITA